MENKTVQIITIPINTEMDPATLLEIAISLKSTIEETVESYGDYCFIDEDDIAVEEEVEILKGD